MDNLYTLLRAVDNSHSLPLTPKEAADLLNRKKAHFHEEAKTNPLAREILRGGQITCEFLPKPVASSILVGPATFFRVHELLRKTRSKNFPLQIGGREFPHNEVVDLYERCVPNVQLHYAPWCSLARYATSLGLAWGCTLLVALVVGHSEETRTALDSGVLYYMGLYTTLAALLYTALKKNRDVRHSAPWNTAVYLDLTTDLIRREQPAVAAAHKDILPRQKFFKTPEFYHAIVRKIEAHGFDAELNARLNATQASAPASVAPAAQNQAAR
ncbi:MAG: hypothetical protein IPP19_16090 [Verrucomicrobia bacterium]|nr:hypothetical protein [Verrucomicrobiota bacterium]